MANSGNWKSQEQGYIDTMNVDSGYLPIGCVLISSLPPGVPPSTSGTWTLLTSNFVMVGIPSRKFSVWERVA